MRADFGGGVEAADAEVQAHGLLGVQVLVVGGAGEGGDVGIAAGIDDGFGLDHAEAALVGDDHSRGAVALTNDIGHDRVVQELGAGLLHEAVGLELEALDVEVDDVAVEVGQGLADLGIEAEASGRQVSGGGGVGGGAGQVKDDAANDGQTGAQVDESIQRRADHTRDVAASEAAALNDEG